MFDWQYLRNLSSLIVALLDARHGGASVHVRASGRQGAREGVYDRSLAQSLESARVAHRAVEKYLESQKTLQVRMGSF